MAVLTAGGLKMNAMIAGKNGLKTEKKEMGTAMLTHAEGGGEIGTFGDMRVDNLRDMMKEGYVL